MSAVRPLRLASITLALATVLLSAAGVPGAQAQTADMQRKCFTLLTCNYAKGGSYRGCLSSYSCRQCGFVPVRCSGRGARQCRELRCNWGA